MELLPFFRVLWRRRLLVAAGAVAALLLAVAGAATSSAPSTGTARIRLALDTAPSQLVRANPAGVESLPWRAQLLADLMGSRKTVASLAHTMGVAPSEVRVLEPLLATPPVETALANTALKAGYVVTEPYVVTLDINPNLPIVSIRTTAPDRTKAARLADAAADVLMAAGSRRSTAVLQGFVAEPVSPVSAREVPGRGTKVKAVGMAFVAFCLWCLCVAVVPNRVTLRRLGARLRAA